MRIFKNKIIFFGNMLEWNSKIYFFDSSLILIFSLILWFCIRTYFLKSTRPSLPLKKAPPLTPTLSPQERGRKPPYSVLEPLRYKVGGPSEVSPDYAGWDRQGWKGNMREFKA